MNGCDFEKEQSLSLEAKSSVPLKTQEPKSDANSTIGHIGVLDSPSQEPKEEKKRRGKKMIYDCPRCGVRQDYYEGKKCFNCELTKVEALGWVKNNEEVRK